MRTMSDAQFMRLALRLARRGFLNRSSRGDEALNSPGKLF
jgi:hypothetical protein